MRAVTRRLLLLLPVLAVLLAAGAYLLINAWLDGAGGRQALERALSERLGLPVSLRGEFDVMLLPSVGVSGTDLVLGAPGTATELGRSSEYAVALELRPLLDRRLVVASFELAGGRFYVERWPAAPQSGEDVQPAAPLQLPRVHRFAVDDFELHVSAETRLRLQSFEIEDFAPGVPAPFELVVAEWGTVAGRLTWADDGVLEISADWTERLPGPVRLDLAADLAGGSGSLAARWQRPSSGSVSPATLAVEAAYALDEVGLRLDGLRAMAGEQAVTGSGCLLLQDAGSLELALSADALDVDALPDLAGLAEAFASPQDIEEAAAEPGAAPFGLNLSLRVGELRAGGAVAREAEILLGREPDCSAVPGLPAAP